MKFIADILYHPDYGVAGTGDLYLPKSPGDSAIPMVLLIHGGGWNAMDKSSQSGVAQWLCGEVGFGVFNINYRLSDCHPWPACGDDCLNAAKFILFGGLQHYLQSPPRRIAIMGASAGGHLALMTGLRLPPEEVAGIVSISGISHVGVDHAFEPNRYLGLFHHRPTVEELAAIDPATYHHQQSPKVLCTHDEDDNVVLAECDRAFAAAVAAKGASASVQCYFYRQPEVGFSHRIWIPGSDPHRLYPELEATIAQFLTEVFR